MACPKFLTFRNGLKMPALGIGTWRASEEEIEFSINEALEAGYRHIDTAPVYLNEAAIGRVLKRWLDAGKVKREELFIVTKLPPTANRPQEVEETLRKSLTDLQLDYVDLYLVHTPFTLYWDKDDFKRNEAGEILIDASTDHIAVWKKMEEAVQKGLTKSIGISNFNKTQIARLLNNCNIRPANLQIEHHIYLQQRELVNYCKQEGIVVTAYSPLGSKGIAELCRQAGVERHLPDLLEVPAVREIAAAHGKSPAQVLLRWIIEHDLAVIPKSSNAKRLRDNLNIFDFSLSEAEIARLDALDANVRVCDFSFFKGVNKHPEFPF